MLFDGMDVDVVRSSGEALKRYARELAEVEQNIDSLSRRLRKVWAGQDAERFEYVWHSKISRSNPKDRHGRGGNG